MLMERHAPFAMKVSLRMTGNPDDAEEIVQEAFLRVWRKAEGWRAEGDARFTTWLYRVVANLCIDRRRRPSMIPMDDIDEPPDPQPSGFDRLKGEKARQLVHEALARLPDRQRAAMSLCHLGEMGNQEAADVLGISVNALESLLTRGRKGLREFFLRRRIVVSGDLL